MRSFLIPLVLFSMLGCRQDDDGAPPDGAGAGQRASHAVVVVRQFPPPALPVTETVQAPVDADSVALAVDLGDYWGPSWTTTGPLAIYGQTRFWMAYRPQGEGCRIVIRYEPQAAPSAVQ